MNLPRPPEDRIAIIKAVLLDEADASVLTDLEMAWLENHAMEQIIDAMHKTNPLVFNEQEPPTVH